MATYVLMSVSLSFPSFCLTLFKQKIEAYFGGVCLCHRFFFPFCLSVSLYPLSLSLSL